MSDSEEKVVCSSCGYDCGGRCPLQFHVKDGVITKVEPLKGEIGEVYKPCARGRALREMIYNPNRLKYPLKRVGARGEGKFERVSWDEALDIVAAEMLKVKEKYGNSAILYVASGGNHGVLQSPRLGYRLFNMFGGCTAQWGLPSFQGLLYSSVVTYGVRSLGSSWEDLLNSKEIILWGFNPAETKFDSVDYYLAEAKAKGIKIICVDPRYTDSAAAYASQWIPIYPSTDTAMLVAMAYVIISEGLQDQDFIDRYTIGFDRYKDYVLGKEDGIPKTPAWAEVITGVPAATIEGLSREYAASKPAALIASWAAGRTAYGEQFHRAAQVLTAITGNIGIYGGWASQLNANFWPAEFGVPVGRNPVQEGKPIAKYQLTGGGYPKASVARIHVDDIWDAILKGKAGGYPTDVKLMYTVMANPLSNLAANTNLGAEAAQKLDFIVVHELLMTSTARYADIVLPVTSFAEREDFVSSWMTGPYIYYQQRIIEPLGECKSDLQIFTELAPRLGIKDYNDKTDREWLKEIAEGRVGIPDYEEFRTRGIHKVEYPSVAFRQQILDPENNPFHTPSGKIEIYSQTLADMDTAELPAIPKYIEGWEGRSSSLSKKYPLQLISVHFRRRVHFQFEDVPWLHDTEPHALWLNSIDAEARGISNGDLVQVFNYYGKTQVYAKVTERIMPGVVSLPECGQFRLDKNGVDRGGNVNTLTGSRYSAGGSFACNHVLVQVKKV